MLIGTINGFEIHWPQTGGKAGKGCNATSSIQLRKDGMIVKQFRFVVGDLDSRNKAVQKIKAYAAAAK